MLGKIFIDILNMSYVSSIVILFILVARMLLKKAPKKYSYILWTVALLRLIVPISFESILSLIPVNPTPIPNDILYNTTPQINTGILNIDKSISGSLPASEVMASVNPMQIWIYIGSLIWIIGIAVLLVYGIASLIRMKSKLENVNCEKDNVYQSDNVDTPFVLGLIQPKIYLPASLSESEKEYILLHEQTHIKRFDHVIRFISYLVLCIHWFNPLVWIAFWLSGKDMEMSCDESVISQLGYGVKKDYSKSLLNLATGRRNLGMIPLAFGEGDTKGRIKNILNFKKPIFGVIGFIFFVIIILAIGLSTNPEKIALPDSHFVQTIEMEQFNEGSSLGSVIIHNEESIEIVVTALKGARKTMGFSTNDYPAQSNYLIVRLNQEYKRRTLYLYSENESYYIEEPYVGIYKSNRSKSVEIYKVYTGNSIQQVEGTDGLNDTWIQKPSRDPVEVVQSAIENQIYKDYTIAVRFGAAEVDDAETQRKVDGYKGSELADKRGWTEPYLTEHFLVVKASYYVEYDHTKTFMQDGNLEQYFYLTRDVDTDLWSIVDNTSAIGTETQFASEENLLEEAIGNAILDYNTRYWTDIGYAFESHVNFKTDSSENDSMITVYSMVLFNIFDYSDMGIESISGSHIPTKLTFKVNDSGEYELVEYWIPGGGSDYEKDIREVFPDEIENDAMDTQKYILLQQQSCYQQAVEALNVDTDKVIDDLLEVIMSSPMQSSNPGDYIDEHRVEYRELTYYGDYTLAYIEKNIENGATGLKKEIMEQLAEILSMND